MKKQRFVVSMIIILLLATFCNSRSTLKTENPEVTITTTHLPATITAKFIEQVDVAEEKWKTLKIKNYHIVVKFYENFSNGFKTQRDITVRNNQTVKSFCKSNNCPAFVLADVFTVDDLFLVARGSTLDPAYDEYNECVQSLGFDETYGFPKFMEVDCLDSIEEEHSFEVILFEILK